MNKDTLIEKAFQQISKDIESGDESAIYELLEKLPTEALNGYLQEDKVFDRNTAIDLLIDDDMYNLVESGDSDFIRVVLKHGFTGYTIYSDEELLKELTNRDLENYV